VGRAQRLDLGHPSTVTAQHAGTAAPDVPSDPSGGVADSVIAQVAVATGDGVVICDEDLSYVWANPAACRIMGYRLEELVGRDFLVSFPERVHASMVEAYRAQLAGQTGTFTGTLLRRDGSELDMAWTNTTFVHAGRRYGAAIFREATRTVAARDVVGLASAAEIAAAGGDLIEVLTQLADSGRAHTRALAVALDLVDPDLVIRRGGRSGAPRDFGEAQTAVSAAGGRIPFIDVWYSGRAVVLADARTRLRRDPTFTPLCDALDAGLDWQTAVYVAIAARGKVLGGLCAYFPAGVPAPTEAELTYLTALADYGALAVEQDRLRRAGEHAAAVEERNRLARELHDSVSQALFSMTMHARAAQKALDRAGDPAAGGDRDRQLAKAASDVTALRDLTAAALADMRALIFELRPDAVAEHGVVDALARQATALSLRNAIEITVTGPAGRLPLPPQAEEQAYRIALEAVHNAVKHADATTIRVDVTDLGDAVAITVADDGRGFEPTAAHPGHLGLTSMRERAAQVGGDLQITTAPGTGTGVRLTLAAVPPVG
jgi:PAS domain S-box-containing protein